MLFYFLLFLGLGGVVALIWFLLHVKRVFDYGNKLLNWKEEEKMNGGVLIAETLKAHGVKQIFALCGLHVSSVLVECKNAGIKVQDVRHEATAAFAADAVSRLTGETGFAVVTAGPGVTNTITALKNAQVAQTPMILMGGAAPTLLRGRGSLQDIDQVSIVKSICKRVVRINKVSEIVYELKKCFQVANEGVPGPCFIEVPLDLLFPIEAVMDSFMKGKKKKKQSIVDYFVKYSLFSGFYNGFENIDYTPFPIKSNVNHSRSDVQYVAKLLQNAERPIMVLGSQVSRWKDKMDDCVRVLDKFEIPFFCSGKARGITGIKNEYFFKHKRNGHLRSADLILLFGVCPDFRLNYGQVLNKRAKIIAVNLNPEELKLNTLFWKPTKAYRTCCQQFLIDLGDEVKDALSSQIGPWLNVVREAEEKEEDRIKSVSEEICLDGQLCNPLDYYLKTDKLISDDAIIIVDGGDFAATCAKIIRPRGANQWLDPGPFGTLGVGAGFSLGAKTVFPERDVWVFYGDGAFGYSLIEFDSFDRLGMKGMINVIGNDGLWNQVRRYQVEYFNDDVGCNILHRREYERSAAALGCKGMVIQKPEEIEEKMEEVMKEKEEKVVCVNLMIGGTKFREGSNYL